MSKILLAGATGYLGGFILRELEQRNYSSRIIVRNAAKLPQIDLQKTEVINAEITKPETIKNICKDVDTIISTVGITKQKDGLTYMDVDYQANQNLLNEAVKSGVKKFIYVSVLNGEKLRHLNICEAKERFVDSLKASGINYCIIRPNGFFSDMTEFYNMAKNGRIFLFGSGSYKANPIHGKDLANVCVNNIELNNRELKIGGPQILTQYEIAEEAFEVLGKKSRITFIPDTIRKLVMVILKYFSSRKTFGPIEFFMTVMAMDMVAPEYGTHTLRSYFESLNKSNKTTK